MAHEITAWRESGCALELEVSEFSDREKFSREINHRRGGGGALNADYRIVEAVAIISGILGRCCLRYGEDFIFKTSGLDEVILDFRDKDTRDLAEKMLRDWEEIKWN